MSYTIRRMKLHDLTVAIEWAGAEGWNPGRHDLKSFYAADPNGFFLGEYEGNAVATFSAVAYDASYGFVGFYIVHPDFRGRGFGLKIWNAGLDYLGKRTIGLDGVVAQQANYQRSGFSLLYRNVRYQGESPKIFTASEANPSLIDARILPIPQLRDFDRHYFPSARDAFLSHWLAQPESIALAHLENDVLDGYGVIRPARDAWRIGPLFARSEATALALFEGLLARIPGEKFVMDVPEANPAAVRLAKRYKLEPCFETARMYRGPAPQIDVKGMYGVTTLELG